MADQKQSTSRVGHLAASILEHSKKLEAYYQEHDIQPPTFDITDAPAEVQYTNELQSSKTAILDATAELNDLLTGPRGLVSNEGFQALIKFSMIRFINDFQMLNKVPIGTDISYEDLAAGTGLKPSTLRQLLRAAMTFHLFQEKRPGYVSHSSVTRFLLKDDVLHDCTGFTTEDMMPGFLGIVDALRANPAADDPSKSGYMVAHGANEPSFYVHLAKDHEKIRRFTNCMGQATAGPQWSMHFLTDYFPWASLGAGTVVDVGGSTGQAAFAIAAGAPQLKLIVQDMADTVAVAQEKPGVNVSHMTVDFFSEQPVRGADVYLFRSVLHNWPDLWAARILRAHIPALKPGAKILVMDELMPDPQDMTLSTARTQRLMDLAMLALGNSTIRDEEGWRGLCKEADERFVVEKVTQPEGSHLALIEVTWKP
ncbi:S-adenosyl-L-methionine-dependent methyltransferase [Xylariales sp. AK1849]|nr:S-adenosyl-L-methionine-dependent methyltransferase [Xylariales sp. AK1849]